MTRIVIMAPNWLGDAVMALPAIRDARRHFADAHFSVGARPSVAPLFRAVPGIDEIVTLNGRKAVEELRADIGILLPNSFRSAWVLKGAGVRERWGYRADFRGFLLTKGVSRPRHKVHFGEYYQNLVRELGIETGPLTPQLIVPAGKIVAGARLLQSRGWTPGRTLVGLAPGAAFGHAKRWPSKRYGALVKLLIEESGAMCVLLGRDEDRDAGRIVESAVVGDAAKSLINLIGLTDLLGLMGVLAHCRAVVANDSGALHLAAAMGTSVTAIHGPTDERYSVPLSSFEVPGERVGSMFEPVFCRPCFLRECPIDHRCMTRIPTERVFASVRRQLQADH
jgi:heptosyltransferase II